MASPSDNTAPPWALAWGEPAGKNSKPTAVSQQQQQNTPPRQRNNNDGNSNSGKHADGEHARRTQMGSTLRTHDRLLGDVVRLIDDVALAAGPRWGTSPVSRNATTRERSAAASLVLGLAVMSAGGNNTAITAALLHDMTHGGAAQLLCHLLRSNKPAAIRAAHRHMLDTRTAHEPTMIDTWLIDQYGSDPFDVLCVTDYLCDEPVMLISDSPSLRTMIATPATISAARLLRGALLAQQ